MDSYSLDEIERDSLDFLDEDCYLDWDVRCSVNQLWQHWAVCRWANRDPVAGWDSVLEYLVNEIGCRILGETVEGIRPRREDEVECLRSLTEI